jgi:hypothetical protein
MSAVHPQRTFIRALLFTTLKKLGGRLEVRLSSILEALAQTVAGAWMEGLRGRQHRIVIGILILAPIIILAAVYVLIR